MLDPYSTLQVKRDATIDEIKVAYRRLVKQLHPDLHPNDPAAARRFNDVTGAYDLLSDAAKRRNYDHAAGSSENGRRGPDEGFDVFKRAWSFRNARNAKSASSASERPVFSERGAGQTNANARAQAETANPARRGGDLHQTVQASFIEATLGAKMRISLEGRIIEITIPALTEDGRTLRLKDQGAAGAKSGMRGDAFILINVAPHPLFTRNGLDIRLTLPVSLPEAVLGAGINVPTLYGLVQLKVPPGSNTDSVLRLRGKGLRAADGVTLGDQLVVLKVVLPDSREPDFIDLIEAWSKGHHYAVRPSGWENLKS